MSDVDEPEDRPDESPAQPSAVDPRANRKLAAKKKLTERDSREFWAGVFASEIGRREMWGLLQSAHTFEVQFACGPNGAPQSEATFLRLGEQLLGQRFYQTWLTNHRDAIASMHIENDVRFKKAKS